MSLTLRSGSVSICTVAAPIGGEPASAGNEPRSCSVSFASRCASNGISESESGSS